MKKPRRSFRGGQSTLEYAIMFIVVSAAIVAMFNILNRHVQGSWRQSADLWGGGRQFENGVTQVTE